jgi:large subunit ribosomal protein L24
MAIAKRKLAEPVRIDIKKEDTVKVITGRDKGKQGRVLSVNRDTGKVLVEHVMMIKRHTRPNPGKQINRGAREPDPGIECDAGVPRLPQGGAGGASHRPYRRR